MRKIVLMLCCGIMFMFAACKVEIPETGVSNPVLSISNLKKIYNNAPVLLSQSNMKNSVSIAGLVISDPDNENSPVGKILIQDYKNNMVSGIVLDVGSIYADYKPGDSIKVHVEGLTLERKMGLLQVSNVSAGAITKIAVGRKVFSGAILRSIGDLVNNVDKYEGTMVSMTTMFTVDHFKGKTYGEGLKLTDWVSEINVHIEPGAAFKMEEVPGFAHYNFLIMRNADNDPVLWLLNTKHVEVFELEEHKPGKLYERFPEDFSDNLVSAPTLLREVVFPTTNLPWRFKGAHVQKSGNFIYANGGTTGDGFAAMVTGGAGSFIELNKNLYYGASKIGVYLYPATSADAAAGKLPMVVKLEYSQDSGESWHLVVDQITITENKRYLDKEIDLNLKGIVRFKITLISTGAENGRLGVDYFRIYQN